jgi:hypothetical protein
MPPASLAEDDLWLRGDAPNMDSCYIETLEKAVFAEVTSFQGHTVSHEISIYALVMSLLYPFSAVVTAALWHQSLLL